MLSTCTALGSIPSNNKRRKSRIRRRKKNERKKEKRGRKEGRRNIREAVRWLNSQEICRVNLVT